MARLDVTDAAQVDDVVAGVLARHGRIDVLVNNAGYGLYGPVECGTEEQLWRQLDTNTFGPWRMTKAVLPAMRSRGAGKVVNVTSLSGRIVAPMLAHYAATKFALEALGEGLRFEVGPGGSPGSRAVFQWDGPVSQQGLVGLDQFGPGGGSELDGQRPARPLERPQPLSRTPGALVGGQQQHPAAATEGQQPVTGLERWS